jgi:hypothetical protein
VFVFEVFFVVCSFPMAVSASNITFGDFRRQRGIVNLHSAYHVRNAAPLFCGVPVVKIKTSEVGLSTVYARMRF